MDRRIYGRLARNDLGVYQTRRYPKGNAQPSNPASIMSRNPLPVLLAGGTASIAPHAATVRFTYTVPPMRRAVLQAASAVMTRATVAAPGNNVTVAVRITRNGTTRAAFVAGIRAHLNTDASQEHAEFSGHLDLFAGDTIDGITEDVSTGGTVAYNLGAHLIEYDENEAAVGAFVDASDQGKASDVPYARGWLGGGPWSA